MAVDRQNVLWYFLNKQKCTCEASTKKKKKELVGMVGWLVLLPTTSSCRLRGGGVNQFQGKPIRQPQLQNIKQMSNLANSQHVSGFQKHSKTLKPCKLCWEDQIQGKPAPVKPATHRRTHCCPFLASILRRKDPGGSPGPPPLPQPPFSQVSVVVVRVES